MRQLTLSILILAFHVLPAALVTATRGADGPQVLPLAITGRVAETKELMALSRKTLGDHGCLAIRSQQRWKSVESQLASLGWRTSPMPNLAEIDFDKQMVVLVYKNGDVADTFSLHSYDQRGEMPKLSIVMSYVIYKSRGEVVERCNFLLAVVPKQPRLEVSVSTYHPHNGGPYPSPDKAQPEWRGVVGSDSGDVVDSLRGKIEAAQLKIAKGQDLLFEFTLQHAHEDLAKKGYFASTVEAVSVWDGKYSNGYRNHAFEVRSPDGKMLLLQPKEILAWDKNSPHPVAIKVGTPYVLPEWQVGKTHKSLAALGLDTSKVGKYTITGIYAESGESIAWRGGEHAIWGGSIATNSVVVEVAE